MSAPKKLGLILSKRWRARCLSSGRAEGYRRVSAAPYTQFLPIVCGISSDSLNAVILAVNTRSCRKGVQHLFSIWKNVQVDHICRTDLMGVLKNSTRWFAGLILGSMSANKLNQVSRLDNAPMLEATLSYEKIQEVLMQGICMR